MPLRWLTLAFALLLSGCSTLDYYSHLASGQLHLLNARQPVDKLLTDSTTSPELKKRLQLAQQARTFASQELGLPDNRSYRLYADLQRPFVLWNVFATPEFSLSPQLYCFPIAGCVAYRGFYDQNRARGAAALLKQQGLDTFVGGVEAYSTLGWFDDPLLNTMLRWSEERFVAVIFHELAHQQFYVADDTAFNESFATFVEQQGLRQWRAKNGLPPADPHADQQREQFTQLVLATRERLQKLYESGQPAQQMRTAKQAEIERLRHEYRHLRDTQWQGNGRYDGWVETPINNAKLLPFGLYDQWVSAFARLYDEAGQSWPEFYTKVKHLGRLTTSKRQQKLEALAAQSRTLAHSHQSNDL
ncbi:aminopeptidase [Pseudomonas sp. TTU2014-080ASC]|uniref:aminopeptidase n=1 Tax=Pseudomonas sp. TTU2014-080ASC TaxID=1729724 RepID=UPI0007188F90|nr:aminopeptidase [Pseudomonas sp. TTU2014-080ASC]KRW59046.1 aminopeptidase [Pseudomonas sp. TTU2014-080ASC]